MNEQLSWDFIVLELLRCGEPTHLKELYSEISKCGRDAFYIKLRLYGIDGKWGQRPDYTHSVRSTMSSLRKRGMVEHVGKGKTGVYRITDLGRQRLEKVEP